jgi:hypothetical protein
LDSTRSPPGGGNRDTLSHIEAKGQPFQQKSIAGRAAVSPAPRISCEKYPEESRACYDVPSIVSVPYPYRRNIMSKGMDSKKSDKKEPAKTMKEKKAEKKIKKAEKK